MSVIRIAQYFYLVDASGNTYSFQNYFVSNKKMLNNTVHQFAPFRAEGMVSNLTGDNALLQVLFPAEDLTLALLEQADGNRLSKLTFTTQWLNAAENPTHTYEERYVGIGASVSETTVELRFRSAMDSVGSQFPAQTLTRQNVGPLPTNAQISLQ
jgi:hypothetical protein